MIRHEHPRMDVYGEFNSVFFEPARVSDKVLLTHEANVAVITALDDVLWESCRAESGESCHGCILVTNEICQKFNGPRRS